MADFTKFRTSIGGFNRDDVVHYIETASVEHLKELRQVKDANEKLEAEKAALRAELDETKKKLTAANAKLDRMTVEDASLQQQVETLAQEAAELAQNGQLTAQEIQQRMEQRRELLDVSFLVEQLGYLRKGGRCSSVAALGANMLSLRPCIQVKDGQMMVGKKYRGPYVSCLLQYIRERLKGRDDIDTRRIFITESGGFTPEELAQVEAAVRSCQPFDEVLHTRAGCTVSSHCGPRTLGILYFHTK